jgi:predicted N-acetyltransferase YhbS
MGLTIRDAQPKDAPSVAQLVAQLGYSVSGRAVAARLERLAASEADRLLVAETGGEVVGLASIHVSLSIEYDEPVAKLGALVVDERFRRRGIGEALVRAIEEEARTRSCSLVFLTTAERRTGAHAFYRRLGFAETGRRFARWLNEPHRVPSAFSQTAGTPERR